MRYRPFFRLRPCESDATFSPHLLAISGASMKSTKQRDTDKGERSERAKRACPCRWLALCYASHRPEMVGVVVAGSQDKADPPPLKEFERSDPQCLGTAVPKHFGEAGVSSGSSAGV